MQFLESCASELVLLNGNPQTLVLAVLQWKIVLLGSQAPLRGCLFLQLGDCQGSLGGLIMSSSNTRQYSSVCLEWPWAVVAVLYQQGLRFSSFWKIHCKIKASAEGLTVGTLVWWRKQCKGKTWVKEVQISAHLTDTCSCWFLYGKGLVQWPPGTHIMC